MRRWISGLLLALLVLVGGGVYVYDTLYNDYTALSHYEALGVASTASTSEIKRAFRELSLKYHPDKASSDLNTRRFHRISEAAQVLSNEESRHTYDIHLREEQRLRSYQQDLAWQRTRFLPASRNLGDVVSFYLAEFPWHMLGLAVQLLDIRLFFKALVLLGGVIFVFDLASRLLGRVVGAVRPAHVSSVSKETKDESLRAARVRQQQILEEQSVIAQSELRRRKSERLARTEAALQ